MGLESILGFERFATNRAGIDKALANQMSGLQVLPQAGPVLGGPQTFAALPEISTFEHLRLNLALDI